MVKVWKEMPENGEQEDMYPDNFKSHHQIVL